MGFLWLGCILQGSARRLSVVEATLDKFLGTEERPRALGQRQCPCPQEDRHAGLPYGRELLRQLIQQRIEVLIRVTLTSLVRSFNLPIPIYRKAYAGRKQQVSRVTNLIAFTTRSNSIFSTFNIYSLFTDFFFAICYFHCYFTTLKKSIIVK